MLSNIEEIITTHILTSTVQTCAFGYRANVSSYPAASCAWRGGNVLQISGAGSLRDVALTLEVLIDGTDAESAIAAAEEVSELWYDATRFAALSALGVISILPRELVPPLASGESQQLARALVSFEVVVRMT
jgi:hypothetical protein